MGRRAHGECIDRAEYGDLMRATQGHVREVLASERSAKGISQERLARVIGVNREAMRDRLLGRTQLKAEELAALAAFLEVSITDFFPVADRV
jgi:transcriptional regulator with XRE-family HTH domain